MTPSFPASLHVVDSHTEGEPTRVVLDGWEQPNGSTMLERREDFRRRFDHLRRAVVCEPRGHDAIVGALLTPPVETDSLAGVIFFNDVGTLGMCGHGLIGVVRTLEHTGRISAGVWRLDTPAGTVAAELFPDGSVAVENVPSYCYSRDVALEVPGLGRVVGDVSYGGNWFFLAELAGEEIAPSRIDRLMEVSRSLRQALRRDGITGADGAEIDHVELFGKPSRQDADSRNFVLCPGAAYDRSPCGTGTSAKMATLFAHGRLRAGDVWRQEGIAGGLFTGSLAERSGQLIPTIRGRAFVTGETRLLFDPFDPFRGGLSPR